MSGEATRVEGAADPALVEFAAAARFVPLRPGEGGILRFSDMELDYRLIERDGEVVFEKGERGGPARPEAASASLEPVRRALVLALGSALRHRQRLPRFAVPTAVADLPSGLELVETPGATELAWRDGDQARSIRFFGSSGASAAVQFAQFAHVPEDELIAAFAAPDGHRRLGLAH